MISPLTLLLIGILVGFNIANFLNRDRAAYSEDLSYSPETLKEEHFIQIKQYLRKRETITAHEIEKLLDISPEAAREYLQEMTAEHLLHEAGDEERGFFYVRSRKLIEENLA